MPGATQLFSRDGGTAEKLREWSSLIGIVTAIIGNILISFALNIQRYAHIRLGREQGGGDGAHTGSHSGHKSYGTQQQGKVAEERNKANLNAPPGDGELTAEEGTNGSGDYMPRPSIHSRSSSESTMKQSEKHKEHAERKSYLRSPYWWAGIILMIIGEAGNFLAYGFAPASIVSPLGVVALISNCIIAPCLLKERFRQRDFWGVMVAVAGAVVVVLSAKNSENKMGPKDLWSNITRWEFGLYVAVTAVVIIALMWASGKYGDRTILIDLGLVGLWGKRKVKPLMHNADCSLGGYTVLSTKGIASLLSYTLWHALTFPITYLLLFVLVASALLQIRYVNRALQRFDSTQVIPTQFVLFTISVIIGSAVLYRDFESATADRVGKFVGGCVLTFLGVYFITSGRTGQHNDEGDDLDDEENNIGLIDEERYQDEVDARNVAEDGSRRESTASVRFDDRQGSQRRSSKQQADGPSSLPRTPQRMLSTASSTPSKPHMSETEDRESPLLKNPWQSATEQTARPRQLESSISTPLLPTQAQVGNPSTPERLQMSPQRSDRPFAMSRNSVARIMPGPLISPLSSPLSAIVADSLRRGVDPREARRRPELSALRKSKSQRSTGDNGAGEASLGTSPLKGAQRPGLAVNADSPTAKGRSFSVSLGEFFRLKRDKSTGSGDERENDEEHA